MESSGGLALWYLKLDTELVAFVCIIVKASAQTNLSLLHFLPRSFETGLFFRV
jgi:hypothetical protein